jgi:hypothetical protein
MTNKNTRESIGQINSEPRPGNFPLGSTQSRAAARAQLQARVENLIGRFAEVVAEGRAHGRPSIPCPAAGKGIQSHRDRGCASGLGCGLTRREKGITEDAC